MKIRGGKIHAPFLCSQFRPNEIVWIHRIVSKSILYFFVLLGQLGYYMYYTCTYVITKNSNFWQNWPFSRINLLLSNDFWNVSPNYNTANTVAVCSKRAFVSLKKYDANVVRCSLKEHIIKKVKKIAEKNCTNEVQNVCFVNPQHRLFPKARSAT